MCRHVAVLECRYKWNVIKPPMVLWVVLDYKLEAFSKRPEEVEDAMFSLLSDCVDKSIGDVRKILHLSLGRLVSHLFSDQRLSELRSKWAAQLAVSLFADEIQ